MIPTDFTKRDCLMGKRRIDYPHLCIRYRCNECGGRIAIMLPSRTPACERCESQDFVSDEKYQEQTKDGQEVLAGLPPELAAILKEEMRCH